MKSRNLASAILLCLLAALAAGCSTDPESGLIGKWKADSSAIGTAARAAKLKDSSPGATNKQAADAAKAMGAVRLELKKDKTFDVQMGVTKVSGDWSFDKDSRTVQLDCKTAEVAIEVEGQKPEDFKPVTWCTYLDESDSGKMEFYMAPRESVDMIRTKDKKPPGRIILRK